MRASLPRMIVLFAATLIWFGWSAIPASAQAPGMCQIEDKGAAPCQGQYSCSDPCAGPVDEYCGSCDPCASGPRWTFTAEGIALQRSTTRSQRIFTRAGTFALPPVDSKDMDFPVAFGPKLSAVRHDVCGCGWDVEVAYFQVDGFAAETFVPGTSVLVTDASIGFAVTDGRARYTSAIYNGELNVRRPCNEWLTLLAGFRMVELDEHYVADDSLAAAPVPASLNVNAYNHLYGLQLGADAEVYNMGGPLTINGLCKAGIYGNFASQNMHRVYDAQIDQTLAARRDQATFLGEVGVVATYALTKRLAFRASYEAIWLNGVALAPEQIGANDFAAPPAVVDTAGALFYHGGGLGFEYRF